MDARALAADIALRWERLTAVDALLDATERGDAAAVRALTGGDLIRSALDAEIWTRVEVLSCMALSGCGDLAEEAIAIIRREPGLATARLSAGQTLLHRAARSWSLAFAEALLLLGADPDARCHGGHSPLYHAGNAVSRPIGPKDTRARALVALFHKFGANLDAAGGVKACTALHMAARRGHADLAEALVTCGANLEARDTNGETPLRRAVNCARPAVVRILLALGADPHSRCARGRTPAGAARTDEMRKLFDP